VFLLLLIGLVLVAAAVVLVAHAVALPRLRAEASVARIGAYGYPADEVDAEGPGSLGLLIDRLADRIGGVMLPRAKKSGTDDVRKLLASAGAYDTTPTKLLGYRALSALLFTGFWLLVGPGAVSTGYFLMITPIVVLCGFTIPLSVMRIRRDKRLAQIDSELPEFVDSLVVTIEAGAGFGGAMRLAAVRLGGPLGEEIQLTLKEQDMGLSGDAALENLYGRIPTASMRSFVRSVLQAETMGVPVGEILRSLAVEMRARKRASAEERAQKAPIKMLFPLIFCIFPAILIVLLYPAVTSLLGAFGG